MSAGVGLKEVHVNPESKAIAGGLGLVRGREASCTLVDSIPQGRGSTFAEGDRWHRQYAATDNGFESYCEQ